MVKQIETLQSKLINWHKHRHPNFGGDNTPQTEQSVRYLVQLCELLAAIEQEKGELTITYGFTSHQMLNYLNKHSPGDMGPTIDQHASSELNSRGNRICKRDGASCDILVAGYENNMDEIARYITANLAFDRLYFLAKTNRCTLALALKKQNMPSFVTPEVTDVA